MKQRDFNREIIITTSRSSGPGGQNVNKVNTKVNLRFDINGSEILNDTEKDVLLKKLGSKITKDGVLLISAENNRSQLKNKEAVLIKFNRLLEKAFTRKKIRKPTKPTKASANKRIEEKKKLSEKKRWRQNF
jgi:ribosome-associated protein